MQGIGHTITLLWIDFILQLINAIQYEFIHLHHCLFVSFFLTLIGDKITTDKNYMYSNIDNIYRCNNATSTIIIIIMYNNAYMCWSWNQYELIISLLYWIMYIHLHILILQLIYSIKFDFLSIDTLLMDRMCHEKSNYNGTISLTTIIIAETYNSDNNNSVRKKECSVFVICRNSLFSKNKSNTTLMDKRITKTTKSNCLSVIVMCIKQCQLDFNNNKRSRQKRVDFIPCVLHQ